MNDKEPKAHWSFKVDWKDIDISRILEEAEDSEVTCLSVTTTFRDGERIAVFVRHGTPDWSTVSGNTEYGFLFIQKNPRFTENGISPGETTATENVKWAVSLHSDPLNAAILLATIVKARAWRGKKQRVKVVGY
jgi:hypothetical protein